MKRFWWLGACLGLALFGCDDVNYGSSVGDPVMIPEPDPTPDPSGPTPEPEVVPDPTPGVWCEPVPMPLRPVMAPDLFERVMASQQSGCGLVERRRDAEGDGRWEETESFEGPQAEVCDSEGACVQPLSPLALSWSQADTILPREVHLRGVVTGERRVASDGAVRVALALSTRQDSSTAQVDLDRLYDGAGRLLEETMSFNGNVWFEWEQVWAGDRLEEATLRDFINQRGAVHRVFYTYDEAGRLSTVRAFEASSPEDVHLSEWRYDQAGHPEQVVRAFREEAWLTQSWAFEGNRLVSRQVSMAAPENFWRLPIDSLLPQVIEGPWDVAWGDSVPRRDGNCAHLPTSISHGYPAAEGVYEMGWPVGRRPDGIGFDYGYGGFEFNYGSEAWFGHGGVAARYAPWGREEGLSVTTGYDEAGIMVSDEVEITSEFGDVRASRTRQVEGGLIRSDTLAVEGREGESWQASLVFDYDGRGRLTSRRYMLGGEVLLAAHGWSWDDSDRIVGHTISHRGPMGPGSDLIPPTMIPEAFSDITYRQTWRDEVGEMVRAREVDGVSQDVEVFIERQTDLGLVEGRGIEGGLNFTVRDSQGRIFLHGSGASVEDMVYRTERSYNAEGSLATWESERRDTNHLEREAFRHACD